MYNFHFPTMAKEILEKTKYQLQGASNNYVDGWSAKKYALVHSGQGDGSLNVHLDQKFQLLQKIFHRSSWIQKSMTTLCQMKILNFLWLNWDQYLPIAPTQINIPSSHPQGRVQIYPRSNLLGKTMNLKVHHRQQRF